MALCELSQHVPNGQLRVTLRHKRHMEAVVTLQNGSHVEEFSKYKVFIALYLVLFTFSHDSQNLLHLEPYV